MNKTILMGRLTKDPEVKYLQNENSTATDAVLTSANLSGLSKKLL